MFSIPGLKVISLTDAAAARIRAIMAQSLHDDPEAPALGLRVGVKKGGCAGMEYTIDLVTEPSAKDDHVERDGRNRTVTEEALEPASRVA